MSYGPNNFGSTGIFGRPVPLQRQSGLSQQLQGGQNIYSMYGLPTSGMYVPHQSLVRNSMMLGLRNPFQQLGYGAAPANRYTPPVVPPAAAPVQQVPRVQQATPQNPILGQPFSPNSPGWMPNGGMPEGYYNS